MERRIGQAEEQAEEQEEEENDLKKHYNWRNEVEDEGGPVGWSRHVVPAAAC